jgi:hypothetical protein
LGSARKGAIAQTLEIARDNDMLSYGDSPLHVAMVNQDTGRRLSYAKKAAMK